MVLLESLGLAKVKRVALPPRVIGIGQQADPDAAYAVIHNRMHVLRAYAMQVVAPVLDQELRRESRRQGARASRKLLIRPPVLLDTVSQCRLRALLEAYPALKTVHECQEQLRQLWETVNPAKDDVVKMFRSWCVRAEASGIKALEDFSRTLRSFSFVAEK